MGKLSLGEKSMNLERLLFLREEAEITQEQLGKIIGTKKTSICNWEKNKSIIPLEKLNKCANYFNVSMDYILKISNKKNFKINNKELNKEIIGKNIKKVREKYNLSQRDLAKFLNTTQSTVWAYEKGKTLILTAFAYQICIKYNISMDWICGRKTKD